MSKINIKTTFEVANTIRPIYTGGSISLDASGRHLVTCVGEDVVITDLRAGGQLATIEGVRWSCGYKHINNPVSISPSNMLAIVVDADLLADAIGGTLSFNTSGAPQNP
ncbi:small nucleolar ribonucleoprotein complex subunit [Histoplasma capsulatum H143]|uniref:Small nucleolar ribonucleoprotein complex subunit n=1 Tax=Ajellomyces capsulatus (strain H143) TaxID=544712 RepID=C6H4U6_AJECH|nr:small nucleolar ribonucleoprotein complex subunit [Histoplasma capsulatum H143]